MARGRLMQRVEELEQRGRKYQGAVWIVNEDGEATEDAIARYEAKHGPLGDRMAIVWISTGVPRGADSYVCG
jgi:hypothetical protein